MAATAWQLTVGAAVSAAGMLATGGTDLTGPIDGRVATALAYLVLPANALAYLLWFGLPDRVSDKTTALTTLLIPVVTLLAALVLIADWPPGLNPPRFPATPPPAHPTPPRLRPGPPH